MVTLLVCLAAGFAVALAFNFPDLYDLYRAPDGQPYTGVVVYLASSSLGYGLAIWALAVAMLVIVEFASQALRMTP
jgi:hypothetical protein